MSQREFHGVRRSNWLKDSDPRTIMAPELSDERGADDLADMIERYWRKRGKTVRTRVVPVGGAFGNAAVYCVRSDMVGGKPR